MVLLMLGRRHGSDEDGDNATQKKKKMMVMIRKKKMMMMIRKKKMMMMIRTMRCLEQKNGTKVFLHRQRKRDFLLEIVQD